MSVTVEPQAQRIPEPRAGEGATSPVGAGDHDPGQASDRHRTGRWIDHWEPEDEEFWERSGRGVARRNLIWSILAENVGFSVWMLWSIVVVSLPAAGFDFTVDQLFWLVSIPALVGATLRLPYTFAVPEFGGRNWTITSALLLLIPAGLLVVCVTNPDTPYWAFVLAAATAGVGGGNFASSMTNISFFYPDRKKGLALGLNAAGGNVGVAIVQLLVPFAITLGALAWIGGAQAEGLYLQNAALMWIPLILIAAVGAYLFMDNLTGAKSNLRQQIAVTSDSQTWIMSFLYIGSFGSFIGFAGAFPLLIKTQFPDVRVASFAFLGALVGSLARPLGGWLSDRLGGARVTFGSFAAMALGVVMVIAALSAGSWAWFLASFMLLFVTTGTANGSTYRMIPAIFRARSLAAAGSRGESRDQALVRARREGAAVIGIVSAVGAFGGFLIPRAIGMSVSATGSVSAAMVGFVVFYGVCLTVTWWCYLRRRVLVQRIPSLAAAGV